jgi:hypothetical protein
VLEFTPKPPYWADDSYEDFLLFRSYLAIPSFRLRIDQIAPCHVRSAARNELAHQALVTLRGDSSQAS